MDFKPNINEPSIVELAAAFEGCREWHELIMSGEQFNCFERAQDDDEDDLGEDVLDEDREYYLGIGPISRFRRVTEIDGRYRAEFIEAALKFACRSYMAHIAKQAGA